MNRASIIALIALPALGACASTPQNPFDGGRTVFYNPYAALEIENGPVGPETERAFPRDKGRWIDGLFYPGAGWFAYDRGGNRVALSRQDRRELRERDRRLEQRAIQNRELAQFEAERASQPRTAPAPSDLRDAEAPGSEVAGPRVPN